MHDYRQKSIKVHKKLNGKIEITPKAKVETKDDLSVYYTPGVGAVSSFLAQNKSKTKDYTLKGNTIAVISDGSAVLGLGNIGPEGAIPVMEGKAMLFKAFGGVNAFKALGKEMKTSKVVVVGAGAAGTAIANILLKFGIKNILCLDSTGIISKDRNDLNEWKMKLAKKTNPRNLSGGLSTALKGADAVIGVSKAGALTKKHIKLMSKNSIVFAMANPVPEIMPDEAKAAGAKVCATGRSDFPNQINNSLVFPGVFKGALENEVRQVTAEMEVKAAKELAGLVKNPKVDFIIPSIFDKRVVRAVSSAIK